MINFLQKIGRQTLNLVNCLGVMTLLAVKILCLSLKIFAKPKLIIKEIYAFGVSGITINIFCAIFIGLVLGLQAYNSLILFNAESMLGALVGISIIREIGPVLAAILFASSAGGAMTSEIGLMKTTDQLNALEVMGVNPIARIVGPRFWAGVLSMPFLSVTFCAVAIIGTYLITVVFYGLDSNIFWSQMQNNITFSYDIFGLLVKTIIFGFMITLIAVYNGINCFPNPSGILRATNRTVVWCAMSILIADFMLTVFLFTD